MTQIICCFCMPLSNCKLLLANAMVIYSTGIENKDETAKIDNPEDEEKIAELKEDLVHLKACMYI